MNTIIKDVDRVYFEAMVFNVHSFINRESKKGFKNIFRNISHSNGRVIKYALYEKYLYLIITEDKVTVTLKRHPNDKHDWWKLTFNYSENKESYITMKIEYTLFESSDCDILGEVFYSTYLKQLQIGKYSIS